MLKFFQRKLKYLKNPKLLIPAIVNKVVIKYGTYKYKYVYWATYRNMLKITQNCEGLISPIDATYLYKAVLRNRKKEGDILDFGSYKGLSTCVLSRAAAEIKRNVIVFESFQGLPPPTALDSGFKEGEYKACKEEFINNVNGWGHSEIVKLIEGDATKTLREEIKLKRITNYSFAFIDLDLYAFTKNILFLLDDISKGGEIILVHDVDSLGIQKAIKEFINNSKNKIVYKNIPYVGAELTIK